MRAALHIDRSPGRLLSVVVAGILLTSSAAAQRGGPPTGGRPPAPEGRGTQRGEPLKPKGEPRFARLPEAEEWKKLLADDARISFTQRTTGEARATLDHPDSSEERRAVAIVSLGASGALVERTRLERIARSGTDLERRAAVLALGEMSAGSDQLLEEWINTAEPAVGECALLALLRTNRPSGRRRVEEIAADPSHRLAKVAADVLAFASDPPTSFPTRAGALLLRLRFEGARSFGLVDGETWEGLVVRNLAGDADLVRDIVLTTAGQLRGPAARDHVLAELLRGTGRARLRAAVALIPAELAALVENDLWKPLDDDEWTTLLGEIETRRVERLALPLVRAAIDVPSVRWRAVALAALAGDTDEGEILSADPKQLSVDDKSWLALAIGAHPDATLLDRFAWLGEDKSARARAAWQVTLLRRADPEAVTQVAAALADAQSPDHDAIVQALFAAVHDPVVVGLLEDRLTSAPPLEAVHIAVTLGLAGRTAGRALLREALSLEPPPGGFAGVRLVRALRRNATSEDLEVLRKIFPSVSGERLLDRELALALIDFGEEEVMPILRAGLWTGERDISLLAGGLMAQVRGVHALVDELRVPPEAARSGDLRRIGFAIGEWGGIAAVNALARELRWSSGEPALQGALLGVLSTRTQ
jgi:hypothetical protein